MSIFKKQYKISVCIPVYGTEGILLECLDSVKMQCQEQEKDFVEIVVVDDCSPANTAAGIVKDFSKSCKIPVNFIRHEVNQGLVEARRTAIYAARGKYVFNLDSDDTLPPGALTALYAKATQCGADITQGKANVVFSKDITTAIDSDKQRLEKYKKDRSAEVNNVYIGELYNESHKNNILDGYLLQHNHMGYLWGKLILRETYLEAFNHIPPITCTMCEDFIQYAWLCYESKKYVGIEDVVYNYSINTGISSRSVISDLSRWEMVCSTAGVFTAFYQDFENPDIHFTEEEKNAVRSSCLYHLSNNLKQLKQAVVEELQPQAYEMLCEYWGRDFVELVVDRDAAGSGSNKDVGTAVEE